MKKLFYLVLLILACTIPVVSSAYKITTTNVTNCIHNSDFSTMDGWYSYYTVSLSTVSLITYLNETGIALESLYYSGSTSAVAGIRLYSTDSDYYPINLLNSDTTEIVHDALMVKIQYMGSTTGAGVISGDLSVYLQGSLACTIDKDNTTVQYMSDYRIYELGGFNVSTSQPIYCKATSWTDMYLTFIPPEESDWWQIRDFEICYVGMPNQPSPSGIIINKIELYAIRVDAE
jgi:hypothetical protein